MKVARNPRRSHAELVIVAGLPGSGKTTLAKRIERAGASVRLCPDEWMNDLGIDLHNECTRDRIESLQWKIGRRLLERIRERGMENPPLEMADVLDVHRRFQVPTDEEMAGYDSYEVHGAEEGGGVGNGRNFVRQYCTQSQLLAGVRASRHAAIGAASAEPVGPV